MNFLRRPFRYRNYNAVYIIIGINVLVYLAELFLGNPRVIVALLSMYPPAVKQLGWVWQFVTYMFVHDPTSWSHIIFNMLALFIFGTQVERHMGSREFILYYLLTGILAGVFSFVVYEVNLHIFPFYRAPYLMGASGAIFAVQLAFASFFPGSVIYLWGILPLKAPVMVLGFTALEVILMVTGLGGNVAHMTHLAGFAFGWIYFVVRFSINPWRAMRR